MKRYFRSSIFTLAIIFWLTFRPPSLIFAEYGLPYPSYMPGNKLYRISRILDQLRAFWYWGNIASTKYHLNLADKYLVEAKTLFEYKQYFLAVDALKRSDQQFQLIPRFLNRATQERKDVSRLRIIVREAANKHVAILDTLQAQLPAEFIWTPEKERSITLDLMKSLNNSIQIRQGIP